MFKYLCRTTGAAFLVLHHCSESDSKPGFPPSSKSVQQKINELPEAVVTVAYNGDQHQFGFAVTKNRHGRADPSAASPVWVFADMDSGRFYNDRYAATVAGVRA